MVNTVRKYPPISNIEDKLYYPLSFQQDRLWYLSLLQPDSTVWNLISCKRLKGKMDIKLLQQSIRDLIDRHIALRTRMKFANNSPVQYFPELDDNTVRYIDLSHMNEAQRKIEAINILNNEGLTPMNIAGGQLFYATLVMLDESDYMIILKVHHIISDAASFQILWNELKQIYNTNLGSLSNGTLSQPDYDYKDYSVWQKENFAEQNTKEQEEYWLNEFKDGVPVLELPADYSAPPNVSFNGALEKEALPEALVKKLQFLCFEKRVIMFSVLLSAYYVLLQKYSRQEDIVIGTVFSGRHYNQKIQDLVGFFVNTVAIRTNVGKNLTFESFLKQVHKKVDDAYYMQDYPLERLIQKLNPDRNNNNNRNPLFRAMFNMVTSNEEESCFKGVLSEEWLEPEVNSTQVDILFDIHNSNDGVDIVVEYNTDIFRRDTILWIIKHYVKLLENIVTNPKANIADISLLDLEEKNRIITEWNNTYVEYPRSKSINELFEEQVEKTPDNIAVVFGSQQLTYRELNQRANKLGRLLVNKGVKPEDIVGIVTERSIDMLVGTIGILKAGAAYMPIDPAYPLDRIKYMLKDSGARILLLQKQFMGKIEFDREIIQIGEEELVEHDDNNTSVKNHAHSLAYVMYTSGSTGKPKGVMVEHMNVVRLVKNPSYISFKESDRILQTGAPVFDATTFEIWGALLNGLKLYLTNEDTILNAVKLENYIKENEISILWLTSALFNYLSEQSLNIFKPLRYLLVGGDVLSVKHINNVRKAFRELTIINGYGPTENTTFSTCHTITKDYDVSIPIGKPISNSKAYILDKNMNAVPVGVLGELCVGGDGLARGYLNNVELTTEKFVSNPFIEGERIYKTGDLAKWLPDGTIEFLGRIDNQVKIRGFRIELSEIEVKLLKHRQIKEAVVTAKEDENKNKYLCAYIVSDEEIPVSELRAFLSEELPEYMQPSYFVKIDKLPLNQNGKVDRKLLPEPERIVNTGIEYTAPKNETESKLVKIWQEVLGVDRVGIMDNFFEIGGHSLKATFLMSMINKEFDIDMPLREVFSYPVIKSLAERIKNSAKKAWANIHPVEKQEYYAVSPSQKRMYLINKIGTGGIEYNIAAAINIEGELDKEKMTKVFKELIQRHESFRTSFDMVDGQPVQRIHEEVDFEMGNMTATEEEADRIIKDFIQPFDLSKAPLLRATLVKTGEQKHILIMDMHHIISDGVSIGILYKEIGELYKGEELKKPQIQYKEFSAWQNSYLKSEEMKKQEEYWLDVLQGELPVLDIITDYPRPPLQTYQGDRISFKVDGEIIIGLEQICTQNNSTMYMVLLAAYNVLLSKYSRQEDIIIGTPIAGRYHADIQNIVGMFVNTLAMRNKPEGSLKFNELLQQVRTNALNAYENQEYQFEELVEKVKVKRDISRNPIFDVMFSMTNVDISEIEIEGLKFKEWDFEYNIAKFDLTLSALEQGDGISFELEYSTDLYKRSTAERMTAHYVNILRQVVKQPGIRLQDIELLTGTEKKQILVDFNDTAANYPKDKSIKQLFEEQVEKTPDNIAVVFENRQLTYRELNQRANKLAQVLMSKGVQAESIVGIMLERSLEMIIGIIGILKAGGAYLPIDTMYPQDRINFMLEDSEAKILLTKGTDNNIQLMNSNKEKVIIIDIGAESYQQYTGTYAEKMANPMIASNPDSLAYVIYTSGTTGKPKGAMITNRNVVRLLFNDKIQFDFSSNDTWTMFHSMSFDFSVWEMYGALLYGGKLVIVPKIITQDPKEFLKLMKKEKVTVLNQTPTAFSNVMRAETADQNKELCIRYIIFGGEALKPAMLKAWRQKYPETKLINMYGITETTVHVTYKEITEEEIEANISNIGKPIPTLRTYIMDKHLKLLPIGTAGELCVGGDGVCRGYLGRPELTKEKFVGNPYIPNERLYRSGDLVKLLPNGEMEYLGRIDHQVKIRGHRIELGEIENKLMKYMSIKEAVVIAKDDASGSKSLYAYITANQEIDVNALREYLSKDLPEYMIPSYFVQLEDMPMTSNGKVDRNVLYAGKNEVLSMGKYVAPKTALEKKLVGIIENVLGINDLGLSDDFFSRGGNSILLIQLISVIEDEFGQAPPVVSVMRSKSISELAEKLELLQEVAG